jgi:hypothetical protein
MVQYKAGSSNVVADALSRRDIEVGAILAILGPRFDFIDRLHQAHALDPALITNKDEIAATQRGVPWSLIDSMVAFQGRLYIPLGTPAARAASRCPRRWPRRRPMDPAPPAP